jgi:Cu/Ag efflux protein CusF
MVRRLLRLFSIGVFTLSLVGTALADEVKGTISKVGEKGGEITVKDKAGKEVEVKVSGSRTKIDGVASRSDLKEGQNVTVEHEKGEAKNIKVAK